MKDLSLSARDRSVIRKGCDNLERQDSHKKELNSLLAEIKSEINNMMIDPDYEAAAMIQARDNGYNTGIKSCLLVLDKYIDNSYEQEKIK